MTERILSWFLTTGGFGLTIWLIKRSLTKMDTKLDQIAQNYHACREELPRLYADRDTVSELWKRTNKHAEKIAHAEGLRNGQ